jgi:hypothetical protein
VKDRGDAAGLAVTDLLLLPPSPPRRILILSGRYYSGVIAFAALTAAATANGSEASVKHSAPLTLCAGSEGVEPCDCLPPSRAAPL